MKKVMNPLQATRVAPADEYYIFDLDSTVVREHV